MFDSIDTDFKRWADALYKGWGINIGFKKESLREDFVNQYPKYRSALTMAGFRKLLFLYCKQNGFSFNPHRAKERDWRDKSDGAEYYFICNDQFDAGSLRKLNSIAL